MQKAENNANYNNKYGEFYHALNIVIAEDNDSSNDTTQDISYFLLQQQPAL